MRATLEVCVDDAAGLATACAHGADRIELCSALDLGGLTPSAGLMALAAKATMKANVPVFAMIRPRAGDFCFDPDDMAVMEADIQAARGAGLAGVVLGASLPDGRLNLDALSRLVTCADGLGLTLHRCFDLVPDPAEALEQAITLGFDRILTSGGALHAPDGIALLKALVDQAAGRIAIMAGSGVSADTLPAFDGMGLNEFHGSCSLATPMAGPARDFGFAPAQMRRTDAQAVTALRQALDDRG